MPHMCVCGVHVRMSLLCHLIADMLRNAYLHMPVLLWLCQCPFNTLHRYSASIADEMEGEDVRRKVHISSVAGRRSPDQQIEVKITTKKAAAYPVDNTARK